MIENPDFNAALAARFSGHPRFVPRYDRSFYQHPVYQQGEGIFKEFVNEWGLYRGEDLVQKCKKSGLRISDAKFFDFEHTTTDGKPTLLKVRRYIFDSKSNYVTAIDEDGRKHDIDIWQFGLQEPRAEQKKKDIRIWIPPLKHSSVMTEVQPSVWKDVSSVNHIMVTFSLSEDKPDTGSDSLFGKKPNAIDNWVSGNPLENAPDMY